MAKKEILDKIKHFISLVKQNNISVNKAYLFGSHVFENANDCSDIDVAIISENFGKNYIQETLLLMDLANKIDLSISPDLYTLDEYNKATQGDFLWQEIIQKGIPIEV